MKKWTLNILWWMATAIGWGLIAIKGTKYWIDLWHFKMAVNSIVNLDTNAAFEAIKVELWHYVVSGVAVTLWALWWNKWLKMNMVELEKMLFWGKWIPKQEVTENNIDK
jgi:Zn-dependent protease with chaperone function